MAKKDDPKLPIELSLIDSIAKDELAGLSGDIAEAAIDAVLDNKLLEAIPVVGIFARGYRVAVLVRERLFLRKVLSFLKELSEVPSVERQRFTAELGENAGTRRKAGEALMLLLDRLDDLDKPRIIGGLYRAALQKQLSFDELRRYCMFVDRAYLPDLLKLHQLPPSGRVDVVAAPYLHALGLVTITGEDYGSIDGIGAEAWHEVNPLGKKFLDIAFGNSL